MIGVTIDNKRTGKVSIKDCGSDPVYAIKKILQLSRRAEIIITIMVGEKKPIQGQRDFEGGEYQ